MNPAGSCRRVAELLTAQLDAPLGWPDRLRLRMHLAMCGNCQEVALQLARLRALSQAWFDGAPTLADADLDPPRRQA